MGLKNGPTFGNGNIPLPYMYAVSSDFSCNEGRVVDDEERVVRAADLGRWYDASSVTTASGTCLCLS